MIDGTFVTTFAERLARPVVVKVNGVELLVRPSATDGWVVQSLPEPEAIPRTLLFGTLDGLVGYVRGNRDGLALDTLLMHVEGPGSVLLLGPLTGHFRQRATLASASLEAFGWKPMAFGQWTDLETFIIALQAGTLDTPERAAILKLLGSVKDEAVRQTTDDGVTQTVVAKQGAVLVADVPVPNPVVLAPHRTFPDVEQPASRFVLRLHSGGPTVALFEADGGAWRLEAVKRVAVYLSAAVERLGVAVVA